MLLFGICKKSFVKMSVATTGLKCTQAYGHYTFGSHRSSILRGFNPAAADTLSGPSRAPSDTKAGPPSQHPFWSMRELLQERLFPSKTQVPLTLVRNDLVKWDQQDGGSPQRWRLIPPIRDQARGFSIAGPSWKTAWMFHPR